MQETNINKSKDTQSYINRKQTNSRQDKHKAKQTQGKTQTRHRQQQVSICWPQISQHSNDHSNLEWTYHKSENCVNRRHWRVNNSYNRVRNKNSINISGFWLKCWQNKETKEKRSHGDKEEHLIYILQKLNN